MEIDRKGIENKMIEKYSDLEGKRILEVGCGDGRITAFLAEKTEDLVAIDPDSESIVEARESIEGVDFRIGSGEALEFENESFDLVMFGMSLHHHCNCGKALREAQRVLKSNGQLIILEPTLDGEIQRLFHLFTDETDAIEKARSAVYESDFTLECREIFDRDWVFEGKEELYVYHFEHYRDLRYDGSIARSIDELLGGRIDDRPIVVKETLEIVSMRKENRRREE